MIKRYEFFIQAENNHIAGARNKRRAKLSEGFSSMLDNLSSGHQGYTRLSPEEDKPRGGGQV